MPMTTTSRVGHTLARFLLYSFGILVMAHTTASWADRPDRRTKHTPTVSEVLSTIAPDGMPHKAHNDRTLSVAQPRLDQLAPVPVIKVDHNDMSRELIDVSHYQGRIDWHRVAHDGKVRYAYIKATEGGDNVDNMHSVNLAAARKAGIAAGSYHFYRPRVSPEQQFKNMTSVVFAHEQDLVPLIDIEDAKGVSNEQFIADLARFIRLVTHHYGRKPLLYTGQNFYNKHIAPSGQFKEFYWMIAKYHEEAPNLTDGRRFQIWQYTSSGSIPGIRGAVDRSCFVGNASGKSIKMK